MRINDDWCFASLDDFQRNISADNLIVHTKGLSWEEPRVYL
jgi:hypothetical protein